VYVRDALRPGEADLVDAQWTSHPRRDACEHDLDHFDALERLRPAGDLDRFELADGAGGLTEAVRREDIDDLIIQFEPKPR
jgi:hypothetical protein